MEPEGAAVPDIHAQLPLQRVDELERQLNAIGSATLAIAAERSLPALLQRIVDAARELTGARYSALGVSGEHGGLVEFVTSGISAEQRARIGPPPVGHGLLGVILRGTAPLRLKHIGAHPLSSGFPPHHPPMDSFLGVPLLLRGENLGNLYLTDKKGAEEFSAADERLIVILAAHAAIAIDNARLYQRTNETLERRLEELRAVNERMQRLTSLVIGAQEEERRRISRELHDDTAQALTSLLVRLRLLARQVSSEQRDTLLELLDLTSATLDGVRRLSIDLRPSTLDDLGLAPAVESYAREFGERWGLSVRTRTQGLTSRLRRDIEMVVYRVVQEALTNIAKHAGATAVEIDMHQDGARVTAIVRDDGRGFDAGHALASRERGLGLFGMQERAQLVGGYVDVRSTPGAGSVVTLVVPLHSAEEQSR
jgi:signal transduction histidine kinase